MRSNDGTVREPGIDICKAFRDAMGARRARREAELAREMLANKRTTGDAVRYGHKRLLGSSSLKYHHTYYEHKLQQAVWQLSETRMWRGCRQEPKK